MTVAIETTRNDYAGSGTTGPFAYQFKIYDDSDLTVIKSDPQGVETVLLLDIDYTVTGAGLDAGGTITLTTALAAGYNLTLMRAHPYTQMQRYTPKIGTITAASLNDALDKVELQVQQLREMASRAMQVSRHHSVSLNYVHPVANAAIGFNSTATGYRTFPNVPLSLPNVDTIANYNYDLADAVTQIGGNPQHLLLEGPIDVTGIVTIPETLVLWPLKNSMVTVSGTLTINSPPQAGPYQWITMDGGTLAYGAGVDEVYADWLGDTTAAITTSFGALTNGTVKMSGRTFTGNLNVTGGATAVSIEKPKAIVGNGGTVISGNVEFSGHRFFTASDFVCNGYVDVWNLHYCAFRNIVVCEAGERYGQNSTHYSDHPFIISSGLGTGSIGTFWNEFKNIRAYGFIIAPKAHGGTQGCNSNIFYACKGSYASSNGVADYTDTYGAGLRCGAVAADKCQNNLWISGDLSENDAYAVMNNSGDLMVVQHAYIEACPDMYTGYVKFTDCHTDRAAMDIAVDLGAVRSTTNRVNAHGTFVPDGELYGNPFLNQLEYNSLASAWLPRGITAGTNAIATMEMVSDVTSGNPHAMVLHVTAPGGGGSKTVRFYGKRPPFEGKIGAMLMIKGTFQDSYVVDGVTYYRYATMKVNGASPDNAFVGVQSATDWYILYGCGGTADTTAASWVEINLGEGDEIWVARVSISMGAVTTMSPSHRPARCEIISIDSVAGTSPGVPATATFFPDQTIVYNHPNVGDPRGQPQGWMCTAGGTPPADWIPFGQIGFRSRAGSPVGNFTPKNWADGHAELAFDSTNTDWYRAVGPLNTNWKKLTP